MFHVKQYFDVVVIGGGHAGCEAALASARMGLETLLITLDPTKIAEMSCNPSIGGVGKGQLVKEIDALGGEMGINADYTGIQFKRLNTRKGSAVQSSRCQSDKRLYANRIQEVIAGQDRLTVLGGEVKELVTEGNSIKGVAIISSDGQRIEIIGKTVVITAGTFMRGLMHCGFDQNPGGRAGEKSSVGLSEQLKELGFSILRLKTGTPPRLYRNSIDFSQMQREDGDPHPYRFSFWDTKIALPQVPCYLTYTRPETHAAIRENLSKSPLYSGIIKGVGPRYCPSIEDKVVKFPDKPRHQLFFEPEALDSDWIYPNGISTSLPAEVQERFVRTIPGCQEVRFARHGYAVEYDCIDPRQLLSSLESRLIRGLYFAGQVNGTSGYEEAGAQGLMAGINAALAASGRPPLILSRTESYIGVMVDDLITLGVSEPYRMFTSRAEFRLSIREDNADLRLSRYGYQVGLLPKERYEKAQARREKIDRWREFIQRTTIHPCEKLTARLSEIGTSPIHAPQKLGQLLKRPETSLSDFKEFLAKEFAIELNDSLTVETLEVEVKYEGYINIQLQEIKRLERMKGAVLPGDFDYRSVIGLSNELKEKLSKSRPPTLAEASRISGMTPAALMAILFYLKRDTHGTAPKTV